jgi:hypothetical protein
MNDMNTKNDVLEFAGEGKPKLPTGLNVLTILTIIGCILGFFGSIWSFYSAKQSYEKTKEMLDSGKMDEAPGWMKGMISPEMLAVQQKMLENKLPILILSLVALALCFYGALEMRKRKKQGFTFWLIGEVLPIATGLIFIGVASMKGFGLLALIIPIIFIILYTVNRKELIY